MPRYVGVRSLARRSFGLWTRASGRPPFFLRTSDRRVVALAAREYVAFDDALLVNWSADRRQKRPPPLEHLLSPSLDGGAVLCIAAAAESSYCMTTARLFGYLTRLIQSRSQCDNSTSVAMVHRTSLACFERRLLSHLDRDRLACLSVYR